MPAQSPTNLTAYLLGELAEREPDAKTRKALLAQLLHISPNAAYKKLQGLSTFSVDDLARVASHFGISLDAFVLQQQGYITARYPPLLEEQTDAYAFMKSLCNYVAHALSLPNPRLWYATAEIPVFHYLYFREWTAFKLFMWQKMSWPLAPGFQALGLAALAADNQLDAWRQKAAQGYNRIHSVEFWPKHLMENTLQQLEHLLLLGSEAERSILNIVGEQLHALIRHQADMAETGHKFLPGEKQQPGAPFELHYNEIAHTGNTFLLESDRGLQVFTTFDNPNHLMIQDARFCRHTRAWFDQLNRLSHPISQGAEKARMQLFLALERRLRNSHTNDKAT
jgi:hypothetical protein